MDVAGTRIDYARDLIVEEEIGKGGYGVIHVAKWKDQRVAVKQLLLDGSSAEAALELFQREVRIMRFDDSVVRARVRVSMRC